MGHVCDTCSGTQFHAVDGYFYCQECGTQSQYQQVEMEADNVMVGDRTIGGEIVHLKKPEKSNDGRITSWEEYNYILVGLVDELICLGANNRFKKCVLKLWTRFLQTNEAAFFSLDDECLPRLPVNYRKVDAEILYNKHHRKRAKRRRSSCSSLESAETKSSNGKADSVIKSFNISKIMKKTKEELAQAQFEDYKKLDHDSSSVATSLATSSQRTGDGKSNMSLNLGFTRNARKVLKRKMQKNHIKKHESDYEDALDCHRERVRPRISDKVEDLDNTVLVGILNVALNLTQDNIQCSDLIRFLREGHVSYFNIQHFLPENVKTKRLSSYEVLSKHGVFNHFALRAISAKLVRDLSVHEMIRPDLVALVHRYVDELQLPEELKIYLEKLMAHHPPEMQFNQVHMPSFTPNYEARAISYILFAMKVLFGMDDDRETKISNSAREINKRLPESPELNLFVVEDWLKMLKVRQLAVERLHMPSAMRQPWRDVGSMTRGVGNWRMYVDHIKTMYEDKLREERKLKSDRDRMGVARNTMLILSGVQERNDSRDRDRHGDPPQKSYNFRPTLTPYRDYARTLLEENSEMQPLLSGATEALLNQDFSMSSMQAFYGDKSVTKRLKEALKRECGLDLRVKELGLDGRRHMEFVASNRFMKTAEMKRTEMRKVEIVTKEAQEKLLKNVGIRGDVPEVQLPLKESDTPLKRGDIVLNVSDMDYWVHYTCYRWAEKPFSGEALAEEMRVMPNNFKFLFYECTRIVEQEPRYVLFELALLEKVLVYDKHGVDRPKGYSFPPPLKLW